MFTEGLDNNALKWVREVYHFSILFTISVILSFDSIWVCVFFCFIWTFN